MFIHPPRREALDPSFTLDYIYFWSSTLDNISHTHHMHIHTTACTSPYNGADMKLLTITRTQHITCTYHQLGHQLHPSTFVTYTTRSVSLRSTTYHTHTTSSHKRHQEQDNDVLSLCTQHITARSRRTPGPRQSFSKRETLDPSFTLDYIYSAPHITQHIYCVHM
jgi:hypothetical protein